MTEDDKIYADNLTRLKNISSMMDAFIEKYGWVPSSLAEEYAKVVLLLKTAKKPPLPTPSKKKPELKMIKGGKT